MPPHVALSVSDIEDAPGPFKDAIWDWYQSTIVSSAAPPAVRRIIEGAQWKTEAELSMQVVDDQLKRYNAACQIKLQTQLSDGDQKIVKANDNLNIVNDEELRSYVKSLVSELAEDHDDASLDALCVPYHVLRAARHILRKDSVKGEEEPASQSSPIRNAGDRVFDIDTWILQNERYIRTNSHVLPDGYGLTRLLTFPEALFPVSALTSTAREVTREPQSQISGFTILDDKRASSIFIQPSLPSFCGAFETISDGLLKGLDWSNVFVAGGIILGTLLSTTPERQKEFIHSDIDVYIYGLSASAANDKIAHIYETWKSNLPPNTPSAVVRNSRTITFFAKYPIKRVQIVMKLVKNPREILLNFDLDVASMGWDGKELWALPRTVRALETGYNVFTMNFVHGHFLGERRASQESRVFKYADRGYGIRILPSYIDALHDLQARKEEISHGEALHGNVDLEHIAAKALEWVDIFLKEQPQLECERSFSSPGYKWRNRIADTRQEGDTRPHVSHAIMYQVAYKTTEPLNRDCLTSFERLIRHTHLWKKSVTGEIVLDNTEFASTDYDHENAPLGYDDAPALKPFEWNEAFNLKDLETSLNTANKMQHKWITDEWNLEPLGLADRDVTSLNATRRSTFGLSLEEVMAPDADMIIPLLIPADSNIVAWANKMLKDAFREHGLPYDQDPITMPFGKTGDNNKAPNVDEDEEGDGDGEDEDEWRMDRDVQLDVALWRVTALTCWQLIDRRIDEIAEMLWSYHFGYASLRCTDQFRLCTFVSHLSKRAIRDAPDEEFERFARWVGRQQPVRDKDQLAKWQWDMGGASGVPTTRKGTFLDYATMGWS